MFDHVSNVLFPPAKSPFPQTDIRRMCCTAALCTTQWLHNKTVSRTFLTAAPRKSINRDRQRLQRVAVFLAAHSRVWEIVFDCQYWLKGGPSCRGFAGRKKISPRQCGRSRSLPQPRDVLRTYRAQHGKGEEGGGGGAV